MSLKRVPVPVTEATRPLALEVPTLRFPEFSSCWKNARLADIVVGGFSNGVFNDPAKVGSGYRLINVKDMYLSGTINSNNLERVAISENEFRKNVAKIGDIFFTRSSLVKEGIAYSNVLLEELDDITYDGHLIKMSVDQNIFDSFFLHNLLKTDSARRQLVARGKTGTMTTIGQDDLSSVKLTHPALPEQQKIADFLGAVDARVGLLRRRRDALRTYKRGMMQRLFSQEPRFTKADGSPFPDWQEKRLGDVLTEHGERSSGLERVHSVSVHKGVIDQIEHLGRSFSAANTDHYALVKPGDIIYTKSPTGDFPFGIIKQSRLSINVIVSPLYAVFTPETKALGYMLNEHFLSVTNTHNYLHQLVQKGAKNTINITNQGFLQGKLVLPRDPEEQQKIADTLTAFDSKIDAVTAQIDAMLRFKKGLLQQMFV